VTASQPAEPQPPAIRVVLVDDHSLVRAGVRSELSSRLDVVGEAADVDDAIDCILRTRPDVVLLDVHLPSGTGDVVIRAVHDEVPETRFLALSVSDAEADVIRVIRAGARGYVTKTISGQDLADAIVRVAGGDAVFSPRLAGFVLDAFTVAAQPEPADTADLDVLTPREREVLRMIARGYTYRETAGELFVSIKTVETHVSSVLRKLQLSNRRELTQWASERRLLP
jgi:DNA-binding NarL/FixJ family response regulator